MNRIETLFAPTFTLKNARVLLQPFTNETTDQLKGFCVNPAIWKYSTNFFCDTEENFKKYIDDARQQQNQKLRLPLTVYDLANKQYNGSTSIYDISEKQKSLKIGYIFYGTQFFRNGVNKNSNFLLLDYVFEQLKAEHVEYFVDERNTPSRKSCEYLGTNLDGILRSHMIIHDGFRRNTCVYSIVKSEWNQIKKTRLSSISHVAFDKVNLY